MHSTEIQSEQETDSQVTVGFKYNKDSQHSPHDTLNTKLLK